MSFLTLRGSRVAYTALLRPHSTKPWCSSPLLSRQNLQSALAAYCCARCPRANHPVPSQARHPGYPYFLMLLNHPPYNHVSLTHGQSINIILIMSLLCIINNIRWGGDYWNTSLLSQNVQVSHSVCQHANYAPCMAAGLLYERKEKEDVQEEGKGSTTRGGRWESGAGRLIRGGARGGEERRGAGCCRRWGGKEREKAQKMFNSVHFSGSRQ